MPRKNKNKKNAQKGNTASSPWGVVRLGGFRAEFPQPRLPFRLGADERLPQGLSVYPRVKMDVPIVTRIASIAAGTVSAVFPLDTTAVQAFSTRFASLFREYAIVGARLELRVQNASPASGIIAAYLDEQSGAAGGGAEALARPRLDMVVGPLTVPKSYHLDWTPRDILDLDYVSTATNFTPVWLKIYGDPTSFGINASTTGSVLVTGSLAFEFRGYT